MASSRPWRATAAAVSAATAGWRPPPVCSPAGVTVDAAGNLFIADNGNNRIRKVGTNGIITTVAGNVIYSGFSGDGGAATNAELDSSDRRGIRRLRRTYYIADYNNNRIREVDTNGTITTVAGNGSRLLIPATVAPATNASLNLPRGVAVDAAGRFADRGQ